MSLRIDYTECDTPALIGYVEYLKGEMREINDYNLLHEVCNRIAASDQSFDLGYNIGYGEGYQDGAQGR